MMDQVAALHWIQENIPEFGGDPKNVTIFGHDHGAAFVNILMLSPLARGILAEFKLHFMLFIEVNKKSNFCVKESLLIRRLRFHFYLIENKF